MTWLLQWEFQVTTSILKDSCRYYILGFCLMMDVFRIMNSLGAGICFTSLQSCEGFQSLIPFMSKTLPSPLSQTKDLVWTSKYVMEGKIKWTFNLLMFHMFAFQNSWRVNEGIQAFSWNGMFIKTFQAKQMSSNQLLKTTSSIHGKHLWH
jgi:hypothetical protein